ncbi:MAG TPA: orotidine-5'-phosphate decarboxylase [Candidatus Latescibacteria bacterium]|nr:orotidine-5'-phosphate decarboxylase [Candidatus Latescibacterota bacterium]
MKFGEKLANICEVNNSLLCVGLDADISKLPSHLLKQDDPIFTFNRSIIDSTRDLVCGYKLNIAFYEFLGREGLDALKKTIDYIPDPLLIIIDAKRGDIGNTAQMYAKAFYEVLGADAVTVNPYMGFDGVSPFLEYKDRCAFILCLTSNPGAKDFQHLVAEGKPLYLHIADKVVEWNRFGKCGLVVGATHPRELQEIREAAPELPFLIPGIGVQGGNLEAAVRWGTCGGQPLAIISSSRAIIYASDQEDFAQKARDEAERVRSAINLYKISPRLTTD